MQTTTNSIYFPNLNGVRFVAVFSVLIYHFFSTPISSGHLGVILFFVLSGFLITYLLIEEKQAQGSISIKQFYIRRILRIWPLYFLCLIIASILYFANQSDIPNTPHISNSIIYYLLFIPNVAFVIHCTLKYAGILWSVGSEEQFYFLWPWVIRIKNNKLILGILITTIFFFSLAPHALAYINNNYFNNSNTALFYTYRILFYMSFNSMATGGLLAFLYKYYPDYVKFLFNKILQIICLVIVLYCWIYNIEFLLNDQFYATLFGVIIFNLALNPDVLFSLENKYFNYLGKISYGLYIYHSLAFDLNRYIFEEWLKMGYCNTVFYFILGNTYYCNNRLRILPIS